MNILIVFAHHEPLSYCAALKDESVVVLTAQGHHVQVSDLYAMKWNPVASKDDFSSLSNPGYVKYALEQRHSYANETLAPDIAAEFEKLKWADLVIFHFPIYWASMPAIMKGWVDRVLISGYCYGGKRFYDRGGLKGKKAMLTMTLGGQTHMFARDGIHGELQVMLQPLLRGTLAYVGFSVLPPFTVFHVPYSSTEELELRLDQYGTHLRQLDALAPLVFPSMDDFDHKLYPKPRSHGAAMSAEHEEFVALWMGDGFS